MIEPAATVDKDDHHVRHTSGRSTAARGHHDCREAPAATVGGACEAPRRHGVRGAPVDEKPKVEPNFKPYSLSFRFDEELNRVVVKVIDPTTGELLREIPPEGVIEALKQLRQMPGSLVDEEA